MFFSRLAIFALPAIAAAAALPRHDNDGNNTCSMGTSQYCCNSVQNANALSASQKALAGLLGGNVDNVTAQFGLTCNPITGAVGVLGGGVAGGSAGCNAQSVCCQNASANGAVAVNCTPIIVNL